MRIRAGAADFRDQLIAAPLKRGHVVTGTKADPISAIS